jgi:hypothetical protein
MNETWIMPGETVVINEVNHHELLFLAFIIFMLFGLTLITIGIIKWIKNRHSGSVKLLPQKRSPRSPE